MSTPAGWDALRQELAAFIASPHRTSFSFDARRGRDGLTMALALAATDALSEW